MQDGINCGFEVALEHFEADGICSGGESTESLETIVVEVSASTQMFRSCLDYFRGGCKSGLDAICCKSFEVTIS